MTDEFKPPPFCRPEYCGSLERLHFSGITPKFENSVFSVLIDIRELQIRIRVQGPVRLSNLNPVTFPGPSLFLVSDQLKKRLSVRSLPTLTDCRLSSEIRLCSQANRYETGVKFDNWKQKNQNWKVVLVLRSECPCFRVITTTVGVRGKGWRCPFNYPNFFTS